MVTREMTNSCLFFLFRAVFAILAKIPLLSQTASLLPTIRMLDGVDGPQVRYILHFLILSRPILSLPLLCYLLHKDSLLGQHKRATSMEQGRLVWLHKL